jgi:hypothetical protein
MRQGGSVVHFDLERLIEVSLHETQNINLVCEKLSGRVCSLEIEIEETMCFTTLEEPGSLRGVLGF